MVEGEAGKKRSRSESTERRTAPASPFVATPPSQNLAKILCVRHDHVSLGRSRARAAPSEAPSSLESERTGNNELAGPISPAGAGIHSPSTPLLARRARANPVASLSVCRVEHETAASACSGDATVGVCNRCYFFPRGDADEGKTETLLATKTETALASGTKAGFANDEANARACVPGTNMPLHGWMQRCFGCGTWTGQAVCLGKFEAFRCNACARQFRKRADELRARGGNTATGTRDDAADAADARQRGLGYHKRAASAESNELTGIASRLREFLLARCPDAGLEHSIANRAV